MALLQEGFFYKTCAMYPREVSEESPCKSMEAALIDSPTHGVPIRVTEDTTMWNIPGVKVGKLHSCYLARYDPVTSIGVIFLGTCNPSYSHRFLRVHGGVEHNASSMLTTIPPAAFSEDFYLNLSHPLRVKLIYVAPPTGLNSLKRSTFGSNKFVGPPLVVITRYENLVPRLLVSLDDISRQTFWEMHKVYHIVRPTRRTSLGLEGGATSGGSGGVSSIAGEGGGGTLAADGGGPGEIGSEDAPWGLIGKFRIGIDIPCILDDGSDDDSSDDGTPASDSERLDESALIMDGELVVSDFEFSIMAS